MEALQEKIILKSNGSLDIALMYSELEISNPIITWMPECY